MGAIVLPSRNILEIFPEAEVMRPNFDLNKNENVFGFGCGRRDVRLAVFNTPQKLAIVLVNTSHPTDTSDSPVILQ